MKQRPGRSLVSAGDERAGQLSAKINFLLPPSPPHCRNSVLSEFLGWLCDSNCGVRGKADRWEIPLTPGSVKAHYLLLFVNLLCLTSI